MISQERKGNIPGPKNSFVIIKTSVKHPGAKNTAAELISYAKEEVAEEVAEENTEASQEVSE